MREGRTLTAEGKPGREFFVLVEERRRGVPQRPACERARAGRLPRRDRARLQPSADGDRGDDLRRDAPRPHGARFSHAAARRCRRSRRRCSRRWRNGCLRRPSRPAGYRPATTDGHRRGRERNGCDGDRAKAPDRRGVQDDRRLARGALADCCSRQAVVGRVAKAGAAGKPSVRSTPPRGRSRAPIPADERAGSSTPPPHLLEARREEIAQTICAEAGKPIRTARVEAARASTYRSRPSRRASSPAR